MPYEDYYDGPGPPPFEDGWEDEPFEATVKCHRCGVERTVTVRHASDEFYCHERMW